MITRAALTASILAVGALTAAACGPPQVSGIVQRDSCTANAAPADQMGCRRWVNHLPAWNYPAETKWIGPLYEFTYDAGHNGGELLP
jgi:hypothetical protein